MDKASKRGGISIIAHILLQRARGYLPKLVITEMKKKLEKIK